MLFALIGVEMLPELRREEERTRSTKYEGPETSKKCITKKRSGKQPAKRNRRQQDVNQADKLKSGAGRVSAYVSWPSFYLVLCRQEMVVKVFL